MQYKNSLRMRQRIVGVFDTIVKMSSVNYLIDEKITCACSYAFYILTHIMHKSIAI